MTAVEMIDQIKALDLQERAKVLDHLLELESLRLDGRMDDDRFDRLAERVLGRHADLLQRLAQ